MTFALSLFIGPDPAQPENRVLVRKIVQVSPSLWCYEETRITKENASSEPVVHSNLYRLARWNPHEFVSAQELQIRGKHRGLPNVIGFSSFYKNTAESGLHFSVVENMFDKASGCSWSEWFGDMKDRRDMSQFLRKRWLYN